MTKKPLNESILYRLTSQGLRMFLGQAERFESSSYRDSCMVLTNEPVADFNYVLAGGGADTPEHFTKYCQACLERNLPFMAIIFPQAGEGVSEQAAALGLTYAVDFPMMTRDDIPVYPEGREDAVIRRATGADGSAANAQVMSSAFGFPDESARRAQPAKLMDSPDVEIFLATLDGTPVSSVTVTYHGDTCGIWAMGTDISRQREGFGRRLLSGVMADLRAEGVKRFFLGSTPTGQRLYEGLGFKTTTVTSVWVAGETHQA